MKFNSVALILIIVLILAYSGCSSQRHVISTENLTRNDYNGFTMFIPRHDGLINSNDQRFQYTYKGNDRFEILESQLFFNGKLVSKLKQGDIIKFTENSELYVNDRRLN